VGIGPVTAQAAGPACNVQYTVASDWGAGFQPNLTITNMGPAITGWTLQFTFTGGQLLSNGWSGTWTQTGAVVSVKDAGWNGALATGQSTGIGFQGTEHPTGSNPTPTNFTLNGQSCNHAAPTVTVTSPAPGANFTAPATIGLTASATAADGATITHVSYFQGMTLIGTATAAPYSFSWTKVPAGDFNVTAVATDSTGATGTSVPLGVHVASSPTVLINANTVSVGIGGTATFGVSLSSPPATASVTVKVAPTSGDADITVSSGGTLTFTATNFGTSQTVTVASLQDTTAAGTAVLTASATGYTSGTVTISETPPLALHDQRFLTQYQKIHDPANGYFSPQGIPFHSIETLIVEAPDYGHETTSEAFSFWLWLEAAFGRVTKNWTPFNNAWGTMEQFIIPSHADQPTNSFYNASSPAQFAPEQDTPAAYPVTIDTSVKAGNDPLAAELQSSYGTPDMYSMHWLLDVSNRYGYGHCGDGTTAPAFINTFQRGSEESVWRTIPQPSCETFNFGAGTAGGGYLPLFIAGSNPAEQWRYTAAPDADARAVQAAYWALTWATQQGNAAAVMPTIAKASKLGDYLRYSLFDKYFKQIGNCVGPTTCAAGNGRTSEDLLIGWYFAWGGCLAQGPQASGCSWAWRIGDGVAHFGYQNPLAAWAMSTIPALEPKSPTAPTDWANSLQRELQFYRFLQSNEGAIAGGADNSWAGRYGTPPANDPTFYGMFYDQQPVYHNPPSNQWFGWQAWSMERVAEYYWATNDPQAKAVLDKWVLWASANTTINANGTYQIPNTLMWNGAPDTWNPTSPGANAGLHVTIQDFTNDVGVAAAYAKTLSFYAAKSGLAAPKALAQSLLDGMWANFQDAQGLSVPETRTDYSNFTAPFNDSLNQGLFVPAGYSGKMPNGDVINSSSNTFLSIRSWYKTDPIFVSKVQPFLNGTAPAPTINYHRFWAESDIALANDYFAQLFNA
jgi:hypothetical protein